LLFDPVIRMEMIEIDEADSTAFVFAIAKAMGLTQEVMQERLLQTLGSIGCTLNANQISSRVSNEALYWRDNPNVTNLEERLPNE
jgi:hypothetical protein